MITEDYVSFETAKLLKEKGFDVYVRSYYEKDKYKTKEELCINVAHWNWNISSFRYSAPTLQMAMKWLREEWHIFIRVIQSHIEHCACEIYYNSSSCYTFRTSFDSYEEACEAAIKYCLENLI